MHTPFALPNPRRLVALAALALAATGAGFAGFALAGDTTVTLTANGPQPGTLTVGVGDTVVFTNADGQNHSIIASGMFTSPVIEPGQSYSVTLSAPASIKYEQSGFSRAKHGSIAVQVRGTLDLSVVPRAVVYGRPVVISGRSPLPGTPVTLSERAPQQHWTDVGTIPTGTDGAFRTTVTPRAATSYRVSLPSAKSVSAAVAVTVTPQLTLATTSTRVRTGHVVRLLGRIAPTNAASTVQLMAYDPAQRAWKRSDTRPVPATGRIVFSWPVPAGTTRLRLSASKRVLGAGLNPATSNIVVVVGFGHAPQPAKHAKHHHAKRKQH